MRYSLIDLHEAVGISPYWHLSSRIVFPSPSHLHPSVSSYITCGRTVFHFTYSSSSITHPPRRPPSTRRNTSESTSINKRVSRACYTWNTPYYGHISTPSVSASSVLIRHERRHEHPSSFILLYYRILGSSPFAELAPTLQVAMELSSSVAANPGQA